MRGTWHTRAMKRFPSEFEAMLSPRGRRVLAGQDPACGVPAKGARFVSAHTLLAPAMARGALAVLERTFPDVLELMERPIPPSALAGMRRNYQESLPKTVRNRTAYLDSTRSKAWRRAQDCGLVGMLRSESFHRFVEQLSGYALQSKPGVQVICYGPGDYAGPHNDHHPEEPEARNGYVDCHLTFCTDAVDSQWLIYEHDGHFTEQEPVAVQGGVTCYRLPFWHYTTPLAPKPGRADDARRWLVLGTFLDAKRRR